MPKNDPVVPVTTKVFTEAGVQVNDLPVAKVDEAVSGEGKMTFSMFCAARNIPAQRQAGMRAFTKTKEATLSEWVAIFKKY